MLTDAAGFEAFPAARSNRSCAKVVVQASKATAARIELIFITVNPVKLTELLRTVAARQRACPLWTIAFRHRT